MYVGIYAFFVGTALLLPLGIVAKTLLKIIGLPSSVTGVVLPATIAVIAALMWWAVVERRNQHTYVRGGSAGLLTAAFTVLLWTGIVAIIYGLGAVAAAGVVILFVLVVAAPTSFIATLPLIYIRHRQSDTQSK